MAAPNTKELAQCLAFAYFAENPSYNKNIKSQNIELLSDGSPNKHAIDFFSLFSGRVNVSNLKSKYLSSNFPIDIVKKDFEVKKLPKTEKLSYHTTAKKVYMVAKKCMENNLFSSSNISSYQFLDQNDPFVLLLKDKLLDKIIKTFHLPYKVDVLSSVDIIVVNKLKKQTIRLEAEKLLKNETILIDEYYNLISKYMKSKDLFPISLKLPESISGNIHIRQIQHNVKSSDIDIDPYIKFLDGILDNPSKTVDHVEKLIKINFEKFSTGERLNWEFPVSFNYSNILDPSTKKPLANYNLNFNLFAQGYGAGWNGQFDKSSKTYQGTQWVGGISISTFENFAKTYSGYSIFTNEIVQIRKKIFEDMFREITKTSNIIQTLFMTKYNDVLSLLSENKILYNKRDLSRIDTFFDSLEKEIGSGSNYKIIFYKKFIEEVISKINRQFKTNTKDMKKLKAHFVHAQISYFLFHGGQNFELFFKKRLFLTIFGIITKKSHTAFRVDDYSSMKVVVKDIIKLQTEKEGQKIAQTFKTLPHFIIS